MTTVVVDTHMNANDVVAGVENTNEADDLNPPLTTTGTLGRGIDEEQTVLGGEEDRTIGSIDGDLGSARGMLGEVVQTGLHEEGDAGQAGIASMAATDIPRALTVRVVLATLVTEPIEVQGRISRGHANMVVTVRWMTVSMSEMGNSANGKGERGERGGGGDGNGGRRGGRSGGEGGGDRSDDSRGRRDAGARRHRGTSAETGRTRSVEREG